MSRTNLENAFHLIDENPSNAHFVGPRTPELIERAQEELGLVFPPMYREFLLRYGAGNFGSAEIYGVVDENFESSSIPNAIWLTKVERNDSGLKHTDLIIGASGGGEYYCLDCASLDPSPIRLVVPGITSKEIAKDFGDFLYQSVRAQVTSH